MTRYQSQAAFSLFLRLPLLFLLGVHSRGGRTWARTTEPGQAAPFSMEAWGADKKAGLNSLQPCAGSDKDALLPATRPCLAHPTQGGPAGLRVGRGQDR